MTARLYVHGDEQDLLGIEPKLARCRVLEEHCEFTQAQNANLPDYVTGSRRKLQTSGFSSKFPIQAINSYRRDER